MKGKMEILNQIIKGDCLEIIQLIPDNTIDLVYLDPPFFTQKTHKLSSRRSDTKISLFRYLGLSFKIC